MAVPGGGAFYIRAKYQGSQGGGAGFIFGVGVGGVTEPRSLWVAGVEEDGLPIIAPGGFEFRAFSASEAIGAPRRLLSL